MSKFIDRPIFAWVLALVIMLVGTLSILNLPINQYPNIAPPAVAIQVTYPGASPPLSWRFLGSAVLRFGLLHIQRQPNEAGRSTHLKMRLSDKEAGRSPSHYSSS